MLSTRRAPAFMLSLTRPATVLRAEVHSLSALDHLTNRVLDAMQAAEYGERDRFAVRLGLEEAVVNGLRHGNGGNPRKAVEVRCRIDAGRVVITVEDQGSGFTPKAKSTPPPLHSPTGRGVLLMRHFLSSVRYSTRGNRVTLCQRREN